MSLRSMSCGRCVYTMSARGFTCCCAESVPMMVRLQSLDKMYESSEEARAALMRAQKMKHLAQPVSRDRARSKELLDVDIERVMARNRGDSQGLNHVRDRRRTRLGHDLPWTTRRHLISPGVHQRSSHEICYVVTLVDTTGFPVPSSHLIQP